VTTLALAEPDPEAELGCCSPRRVARGDLPDGSFATMPAGDCTTAGGSLALLGPLGDGDGDGVDDGCVYGADRLTLLTLTNTLSAEELAAFVDYENVVCELAGVCGHVEPLGSRDGGAGLTGEGAEDDSVEGDGATGGSDGSGAGAPSPSECMKKYSDCVRKAKKQFDADMQFAEGVVAGCLAAAAAWFLYEIVACALHAGVVGGLIAAICVLDAVLSYKVLMAACLAVYLIMAGQAKRSYDAALAGCRQDAQAAGCDDIPQAY